MDKSTSPRRRYLALLERARKHLGTPEAETCEAMAAKMLARHPELAGADEPELPQYIAEYRYKTSYEHDLLAQIGEYLGLNAKVWTGSRAKVIVFDTDAPTHAAIEHTYETLRKKVAEVLAYAFTGFLMGALPVPSKPGRKRKPEQPDESLLEMARRARDFGASSQPRKAIGGSSKG